MRTFKETIHQQVIWPFLGRRDPSDDICEIGEQPCRMLVAKGLLPLKPATNASIGVISVDIRLLDALGEDEMQNHIATWREFRLTEFTDQELREYEIALLRRAAQIKCCQVLEAELALGNQARRSDAQSRQRHHTEATRPCRPGEEL